MPPLFRTLGPVSPPVNPEDIANKGYVDNISPDVLTYFRLGERQTTSAGSPGTYPCIGDFGLGEIFSSSTSSSFSRAPFPMQITRFGLSYQPTSIASYNNFINQTYNMNLVRYNPSTVDPPFVVIATGSLAAQSKNLDITPANPLPIGISNNDVYQWTCATVGTATNIGQVNMQLWYEFKPVSPTKIDELIEADQERVEQLNQELKNKQWYKELIKDFKKSQKDTSNNATK